MKKNEDLSENFNKAKRNTTAMMVKKKNMTRLGGNGLSLDAFANAKLKNNHYNPSLIKKQREFYKNAKNVKKFKKLLKQQNPQNHLCSAQTLIETENETKEDKDMGEKRRKKKNSALSLGELYKKKHKEKERERMERVAVIRMKKEEIEKAEAWRKATREKMLKKTRSGHPVMKYRIEHLLETIQASTTISADKKS